MPDSERILAKLSHESWELKLSVGSEVTESLKWVWTAEVSIGGGSNGSTVAIAAAKYTSVGMPDGDGIGSYSFSPKLTNGIPGFSVSEFESVSDQWEQECRQISSVLDSSILRRRRDLERQRAEEEKRAANRQDVETYLDSLVTDDPEP